MIRAIKIVMAVILLFIFIFPAMAAESEAEHEALRSLMKQVTAALNAGEIDELAKVFANEFAFTTTDQTFITNRSELTAYYQKMFKGENAIVDTLTIKPRADIKTRFLSEDIGYCYGSSEERYTLKSGRQSTINSRWTALVIKENGDWKISAVHTGVNFLDNPVLTYKSMPLWKKILVFLKLAKV